MTIHGHYAKDRRTTGSWHLELPTYKCCCPKILEKQVFNGFAILYSRKYWKCFTCRGVSFSCNCWKGSCYEPELHETGTYELVI